MPVYVYTCDHCGHTFEAYQVYAADAWHSEKGFIGATRRAQAFVWNKERGLQAIINSAVQGEAAAA